MTRRVLILLFIVTSISGCGSLKSRWDNFTAHYNTFYNAKKNYQIGLDKVLNVKLDYSSEIPIRIHEVPLNSGAQDFEKAIDKGAEVLRKHPNSKWVDDAILLIGKSYYFRKEYFSSEQKFQELYQSSKSDALIQEAVIWKSRVYLEMKLYDQGIQYLNEQILLLDDIWNKNNDFEAKSILAEFYVAQENWDLAAPLLEESVPKLNKKEYRERGFFLLGQVYDNLNEPDNALVAFNKVEKNYSDYNLQYLAKRKKAENARALGDYDTALATFTEMVKDDKNLEFKPELQYEIGRTLQNSNSFKQAEVVYLEILSDRLRRPKAETAAKTYYGLAEIQRYSYNNFQMAAAYYDTASRQNVSLDKLPERFEAGELAQSFGEYSSIKNEIQLKDSLLWVANLPEEEFNALLLTLREQKLKGLIAEERKREQQQNTIVNVSTPQRPVSGQGSNNGFLNVKNPSLLADSKNQFRAIWDDRTLADNWRIAELLRSVVSGNQNGVDANNSSNQDEYGFSQSDLAIDISNVPFSEADQDSMREVIAGLKYGLGNLFFLNLEMPDSAEVYFREVITSYPKSKVAPVSYYSLSELNFVEGRVDLAKEYALDLIEKHASSRYAKRLSEKHNIAIENDTTELATSIQTQFEIISSDTTLSLKEKAEKSTELAEFNPKENYSAIILYKATQNYITLGKSEETYKAKINDWINKKVVWSQQSDSLKKHKIEAGESLKDTTLTEIEKLKLNQLVDSTLTPLDLASIFPYEGEYWDKVRANLDLFLLYFKNSPLKNEISTLKTELQVPVKVEPVVETPAVETTAGGEVPTCNDINAEIIIRGGMEAFMGSISFDNNFDVQEVTYSFLVNQRGIIESFEPKSDDYPRELIEIIEPAFLDKLFFEPVIYEGQAITVKCDVTFPVQ
tara:strand:- start:12004 stop:14721 length:2718 start_codon:yes stop_codon:yes gene_type:complete